MSTSDLFCHHDYAAPHCGPVIFERHFFAPFSLVLVQRVCCVCVHKKRGVRKEGSQCGVVRSGEKIKGRKSESKRKYSPPPYSSLSYSPYTQLQPPGKEKKYNALQLGINPAAVW